MTSSLAAYPLASNFVDGEAFSAATYDGLAELVNAIYDRMVPIGTVLEYGGTTAPTNFALMGTTVTNAQTLYPTAWSVLPTAWRSGANLLLPSVADKTILGPGVTALGATGGANSRTIATGNLPSHAHTIDHDHANATTTTESQFHTHTGTTDATQAQHANGTTTTGAQSGFVRDTSMTAAQDASDSVAHTHTFTTGNPNQNHTHDVNLPNYTGNSGSVGSGTALDTTPAHLALNRIIRLA